MKKVLLWIIGAIVVVSILGAIGDDSSEPVSDEPAAASESVDSKPEPKAKFKGRIMDSYVVNPASWGAYLRVDNVGKAAGTASCFVEASDPSGAYEGFDWFEIGKIKAGEMRGGRIVLTITDEGAGYVTDYKVECEEA